MPGVGQAVATTGMCAMAALPSKQLNPHSQDIPSEAQLVHLCLKMFKKNFKVIWDFLVTGSVSTSPCVPSKFLMRKAH